MIELTVVAVVAMLCGTVLHSQRVSLNKTSGTNEFDREALKLIADEIDALKVQITNLRSTMTQLQLKEGMRR